MSTSFEVFQAQRDLSQAREQRGCARCSTTTKSQVDYETVQVAPVSGGGVSGVGGQPAATRSAARRSPPERAERPQRHGRTVNDRRA